MNPLEQHLRPFRARLWLRRLLDLNTLGLIVGLGAAALIVVGVHLLGHPPSPSVVLLPAAALVIAAAVALYRRPTMWEAARAADGLGLAERATSALHAAAVEHATASLLELQVREALRRVDPAVIRVRPDGRRLRRVAVAAAGFLVTFVMPLPELGDRASRAAARAAIDQAHAAVQEVAVQVEAIRPETAVQRIAKELAALEQTLAESEDLETAGRAIERTQQRVASFAGTEQYASRRTLDALATAWSSDPLLGDLAQALRSHDPDTVAAAVEGLNDALGGLEEAQREDLQLQLQRGANLARDLPGLARALREAAFTAGDERGRGEGLGGGLAPALRAAARAARSLAVAQGALDGLGDARAALGAIGALAGAAASGSGTGASRGNAGTASGGGDGGGAGGPGRGEGGSGRDGLAMATPGSGGDRGQGGGGHGSGGSGRDSGSGGGSGGDSGSGAASGAGTGAGGGSGTGGGAGTDGAGSAGTPTGPDAIGGPGGQGEARMTGALTYEPIYAPRLLGGPEGIAGRTRAAAGGAGGATVDLPESPLRLGTLRPYNQVYGEYEEAAGEALARSPLPPNLEALVRAYFGAIRPDDRQLQPHTRE